MVYFGDEEKNAVTLPHSIQRKHGFLGEIREISQSKKIASRKKFSLGLLNHRSEHSSTRSLMAGDTTSVWKNIELRIDLDPFGTSYQIYSMNKKDRSKNSLKPKALFKRFFMDIIPATPPNVLTSETNFYNYYLIVDAYFKNPKLYGPVIITIH